MDVRIESPRSRDSIDLIDTFRHAGFHAGLADTPGTWDVAVEQAPRSGHLVDQVASVLEDWLADHGRSSATLYAGDRLYVVEGARAGRAAPDVEERSAARPRRRPVPVG
jgi:hypothetical protein